MQIFISRRDLDLTNQLPTFKIHISNKFWLGSDRILDSVYANINYSSSFFDHISCNQIGNAWKTVVNIKKLLWFAYFPRWQEDRKRRSMARPLAWDRSQELHMTFQNAEGPLQRLPSTVTWLGVNSFPSPQEVLFSIFSPKQAAQDLTCSCNHNVSKDCVLFELLFWSVAVRNCYRCIP